jgi:hypothetical protein
MIKLLVHILQADDYIGINERIDIAKGKYHLTSNYRKIKTQRKRK